MKHLNSLNYYQNPSLQSTNISQQPRYYTLYSAHTFTITFHNSLLPVRIPSAQRVQLAASNIVVWKSITMRREENQLDAIEWFTALVICSTCFGHLYVHHQELDTTLVLWPHVVCNALVAGGRRSGAGQQSRRPGWGKLLEQLPSSRTHSRLYTVVLPQPHLLMF